MSTSGQLGQIGIMRLASMQFHQSYKNRKLIHDSVMNIQRGARFSRG